MPEITMTMVWIAAIVVLLIIEGVTAGLVTIWFAIGALAGLICELVGAPRELFTRRDLGRNR